MAHALWMTWWYYWIQWIYIRKMAGERHTTRCAPYIFSIIIFQHRFLSTLSQHFILFYSPYSTAVPNWMPLFLISFSVFTLYSLRSVLCTQSTQCTLIMSSTSSTSLFTTVRALNERMHPIWLDLKRSDIAATLKTCVGWLYAAYLK